MIHRRPGSSCAGREQLTQSLTRQNKVLKAIKTILNSRRDFLQTRRPEQPPRITMYREFYRPMSRYEKVEPPPRQDGASKLIHNALPASFGKRSLLADVGQFSSYIRKGYKILSARGPRREESRVQPQSES